MFGLGKKGSKNEGAEAAPKAAKSSGSKLDIKEFLLQHGEKFVIALVGVAAIYFLWDGVNTETIDESKTTTALKAEAERTLNQVRNDNHWAPLKDQDKRTYTVNFKDQSERSRLATDAGPYRPDVWEVVTRGRGGKRGDPEILAPISLKASAFMGVIAVNGTREAKVEELEAADPIGTKKSRAKPEDNNTATQDRTIPQGVDYGYEAKASKQEKDSTGRALKDAKITIPAFASFASVTAAVPHKELVANYNTEFENAPEFNADRDSPNYLGFEAQRVDVTNISDLSKITENDWKPLPGVTPAEYQKLVDDKWPGTAKETAVETFTAKKLTMAIPPVLIDSPKDFVDHPKIPQIAAQANASSMMGGAGAYGGGGQIGGEYGSSYGAGASYGGGPGGGGAIGTTQVEEIDPEDVAKAEVMSDYKLLRFFDFTVEPGHTYIYRTRLVVEDPNYPRAKANQPKTVNMKPETVKRVQDLMDADAPIIAANKKAKRNSKMMGKWSENSEMVTIPSYSRLFAGSVKRNILPFSVDNATIETYRMDADASAVYGEWDKDLAAFVPYYANKDLFVGKVFGGSIAKGTEVDVIASVSKTIKKLPEYTFSNAVTVAEIGGGETLAASPNRQDLRSGSQFAAFDAASGELIISREFDDYSNYRLYSAADEREKIEKDKKEADKNKPR